MTEVLPSGRLSEMRQGAQQAPLLEHLRQRALSKQEPYTTRERAVSGPKYSDRLVTRWQHLELSQPERRDSWPSLASTQQAVQLRQQAAVPCWRIG